MSLKLLQFIILKFHRQTNFLQPAKDTTLHHTTPPSSFHPLTQAMRVSGCVVCESDDKCHFVFYCQDLPGFGNLEGLVTWKIWLI